MLSDHSTLSSLCNISVTLSSRYLFLFLPKRFWFSRRSSRYLHNIKRTYIDHLSRIMNFKFGIFIRSLIFLTRQFSFFIRVYPFVSIGFFLLTARLVSVFLHWYGQYFSFDLFFKCAVATSSFFFVIRRWWLWWWWDWRQWGWLVLKVRKIQKGRGKGRGRWLCEIDTTIRIGAGENVTFVRSPGNE